MARHVIPSPDKESIIRRYVPVETCDYCLISIDCSTIREKIEAQGKDRCPWFKWGYTVADLEMAGMEIFEAVDSYGIALGKLLDKTYQFLRPSVRWPDGREIENETQWVLFCSDLWSKEGRHASVSTLKKAWKLANADIPDDWSNTRAYEVLSGLRPGEDAQKAIATVSYHGYGSHDIRVIKGLKKRGLIKGWVRPTLTLEDGQIIARLHKRRCVVARIADNGNVEDPLMAAALYMLSKGIGVEIKEDRENEQEND